MKTVILNANAIQELPERAKKFSHRTKTGCGVCRRRKVKCDERRPSCSQCIRGRRQCPGYLSDKAFFVPAATDMFLGPPRALTTPQLNGSKDIRDLFSLLPGLMDFRGSRGAFLNGPLVQSTSIVLKFLPSRASHHAALGAAVTCVAAGIRQLLTTRSRGKDAAELFLRNPSMAVTRAYTTALSTLRHTLDDPRQSAMPETSAAALLICCFETLRDITESTLYWHMRGLAKIFQHRGPPDLESRFECDLMTSCLALMVISSFYTNTPCFLAQSHWDSAFQYLGASVPARRIQRKLFLAGWELNAHTYALLADCSSLVFEASATSEHFDYRRRVLLKRIEKVEGKWSQRQRAIMEQAGVDPEGEFRTFFEQLFETQEGRTGFIVAHASSIPDATLILNMLRVAIGGPDALANAEKAHSLAVWLDSFAEGATEEDTYSNPLMLGMISATLQMRHEWRNFAVELEAAKGEPGRRRQVIDAEAMRRWLILAGITPSG